MRTRRKTVVLLSILLMAGCSANRRAHYPNEEYLSPEPVPGPLHHADEYEYGDQQYDEEYNAVPLRGKMHDPAHSTSPPPMQEPRPAPPAIGISRVKSVSWLRRFDNRSTRNSCGDNSGEGGCATGSASPLTPDYFVESYSPPPRAIAIPQKQYREKTTMVEGVRGWELHRRRRCTNRVFPPRTCGEYVAPRPGCYAPQVFSTNTEDHPHATRDVKQPVSGKSSEILSETHENADYDPTAYPLFNGIGDSPARNETPMSHVPAPAILPPSTPAPVMQQVNPDAVRNDTRLPIWPRLVKPSEESATLPVANPGSQNDLSLPEIQPGNRI